MEGSMRRHAHSNNKEHRQACPPLEFRGDKEESFVLTDTNLKNENKINVIVNIFKKKLFHVFV